MARNMRLVDSYRSQYQPDRASSETALEQKIDALQELACTLVKEVQAMRDIYKLGSSHHSPVSGSVNFYEEVERFEIYLIKRALEQTGGHQQRAAQLLGIGRSTINALMKRHGIHRYGR